MNSISSAIAESEDMEVEQVVEFVAGCEEGKSYLLQILKLFYALLTLHLFSC